VGTLAIVLFFIGVLAIILIHEAGHSVAARAFGFKVQEYFVGFGPRLWSFRRGEIEYGLKAILIGGYVKIAGMNPYETVAPEDVPRAYGSKPIWQRALVIFAGPGTHFVLGALLFTVVVLLYGDPNTTKPIVGSIEQTIDGKVAPSVTAHLQPGDVIVGVDGLQEPSLERLRAFTTDWANQNPGSPLALTIERNDQIVHVSVTPVLSTPPGEQEARGLIGFAPGNERPGLIGSVETGFVLVGQTVSDSIRQLGHIFGPGGIGRVFSLLFTNAPRQGNDATSFVGVGQQVGAAGAEGDWYLVLLYLSYVTVFIGLVNLVPLPPFDGGHLSVLAIEKIRGKTIDMRKLIPITVAVMGFFVLFVMAAVFLDIVKPLPISR
jgi:membrane-associated protease RseP (regulator of RpoE activity)